MITWMGKSELAVRLAEVPALTLILRPYNSLISFPLITRAKRDCFSSIPLLRKISIIIIPITGMHSTFWCDHSNNEETYSINQLNREMSSTNHHQCWNCSLHLLRDVTDHFLHIYILFRLLWISLFMCFNFLSKYPAQTDCDKMKPTIFPIG
jgi:hypothetical protein